MEPADASANPIDERRLALDEELGRKRLDIEKRREKRDSSIIRSNTAVIISAMIALATAFLGFVQFRINQGQEYARLQDTSQATAIEQSLKRDDQRLKVLDYITAQRQLIFADDPKEDIQRKALRTLMILAMKPEAIKPLFAELRRSTPRGGAIWVEGEQKFDWIKVGAGDCGGHDVLPFTRSSKPEHNRCNAASEGRTAVCWDGTAFKNAGSGMGTQEWCTYKAVTPDSCVGGGARGEMYQCNSSFSGE